MAGQSAVAQLEQLLAHHERLTVAIRTTLDELRGRQATRKQGRAANVLQQAVTLDLARVTATRTPRKKRKGAAIADKAAARRRTAALLASFDATLAKPGQSRSIAVLVRHGFLKKKGDGYVRTSRPFVP
jgi:hypothetical protein